MRGKTDLFTSIVVCAVGIALICLYQRVDILAWIVVLIGVMFLIPGLFAMMLGMRSRAKGGSTTSVIAGVGAMCLGIAMCAMPDVFAGILVYIFAALLIIGGIYHIVFIGWLAKPYVLPFYYYILPVLMVVAGVVLLTTSLRTINTVVVLVTGISFVVWSFCSLVEWIATHPTRRHDQIENQ